MSDLKTIIMAWLISASAMMTGSRNIAFIDHIHHPLLTAVQVAAGCCVSLFVYVSAAQCQVGDIYRYSGAFASWLLQHEVHGKYYSVSLYGNPP